MLDPRFKRDLFETNSELFSEDWVNDCHQSFVDEMNTRYTTTSKEAARPTAPTVLPVNPWLAAIAASVSAVPTQAANDHNGELERFLVEPHALLTDDPLAWWRLNGPRFPTLSRMARNFLAIPGTFTM